MNSQIALFDITDAPDPRDKHGLPDLFSYDTIIVAMSGKDSLACFLHLLEMGVPREKIEFWHHLPDGREGSTLFDWPVTEAYEQALAKAFGINIYMSWRQGGLETEMLKENDRSKPISFECPSHDGQGIELKTGGGIRGSISTRRRFPQQAADLKTRWCSGAAKIEVASMALNNQDRLHHSRTLFVTGERAQESGNRANYLKFEPHRCDRRNSKRLGRHVDHYRPVHGWSEEEVWAIIQRHGVVPHPAYRMGWSRLSCMRCIFGSKNQWASIQLIDEEGFEAVANYEEEFNCTIHRTMSVREQASAGKPYNAITNELAALAMNTEYNAPILIDPADWELPAGAFGEDAGPT
ncbi:phosphoadenosine phosphosulfate reductase [Marinobacter halodurans]|uniref:Phosphoadenosine phosphosulfate reductase n=1 Tax=Marinobacter halodurans TaxID=2528979 RepID=A0ABY1ZMB9_9GAMM|nr:phosphoadenosine phosphosulfate reductase family protein [Marinobacter halodurans]TBW57464.1 phosphoadenosine phosphosulfate reductase [Marinobacter halodurans]